ncbi:MAG: uroporphyrinogen decarboxylase family protein [bacterium]
MTNKERMLLAITNQVPDRVPVAPDISNMIPCRLTGKPFWDIYLYNNPPLWQAYIESVKYFGIDAWFTYGYVNFQYANNQKTTCQKLIQKTDERITVRNTHQTPAGELWDEMVYYLADPPTATRKLIKNIDQDIAKLRYFFPEITGFDPTPLEEMRIALGDLGALGIGIAVPGMQLLFDWFDGGLESATYAYYDKPELIAEFVSWQEKFLLQQLAMSLAAKPDFILFGASGLGTMNTPESFRKLSLPFLQKGTRMCTQAGIPSMLHSCGKERMLVEIMAKETDLNCINPLEIPPMGDCNLAEIKQRFGHRLALMGNLHTTEIMLSGTPHEVEQAAKQCIADAGTNGGFILSTGDQCGRDTPDENIFKLVEVAKAARY